MQVIILLGILLTFLVAGLALTHLRKVAVVLSILLISSVVLTPRFTMFGFGVRFEDFLTMYISLIMIILLLKNIKPTNIQGIEAIVFIYLIYSSLITIIHIVFDGLDMIYLVYLLKEIQYFLFFYFVISVVTRWKCESRLIKVFFALSIITLLWGCYQLIVRPIGFYGIGIISETAPSQSGGLYFIISIFLVYLYEKYRRNIYLLLMVISTILTFATISRTAIVALSGCLIIYILISIRPYLSLRKIFSLYGIGMLLTIAYINGDSIFGNLLTKIQDRLQRIFVGTNTRTEKWNRLLQNIDLWDYITGKGKGFSQVLTGNFTLAADSQYIRLLIEVGWIGLTLWILVIFSILYTTWKYRKFAKAESLFVFLITIGFLIMGITHEVFMVAIQATTYWTLIGLFLGKMINDKHLENTYSK